MISAFPKIFAIGTDYIKDIFSEDVEITEKIDGSKFAFGVINKQLYMRSKGAMLYSGAPEKMFARAMGYVEFIAHKLPENVVFYAEYLNTPKHNTLKYDRIPLNYLVLFAAMEFPSQRFLHNVSELAEIAGIECVPVIYQGRVGNASELLEMLQNDSVLGGAKIEGVVVKNYHRQFLLGGQPMPLMAGKFVSEQFKEVHRERWGKEEKSVSRLDTFLESFRTHARWEKAVQHLMEKGELENEPRDIGKLIKEIQQDIEEEEKEAVKEFLWKEFKGQLMRKSVAGMPEWYKERLLSRSFE